MIEVKREFQPITLVIRTREDLYHITHAMQNEIRDMEHRWFGNKLHLNDIKSGSKEEHYLYLKELLKRLQ